MIKKNSYYISYYISIFNFLSIKFNFKKTKYPIIKLSLISIILLLGILLYFRFLDDTKPGEKYNPPKLENGKIIKPYKKN